MTDDHATKPIAAAIKAIAKMTPEQIDAAAINKLRRVIADIIHRGGDLTCGGCGAITDDGKLARIWDNESGWHCGEPTCPIALALTTGELPQEIIPPPPQAQTHNDLGDIPQYCGKCGITTMAKRAACADAACPKRR